MSDDDFDMEELEELREDFEANDADGDGRIDFDEFVRFMEALNADMSEEELRIGFEAIDVNQSGDIDFDELVEWWCSD